MAGRDVAMPPIAVQFAVQIVTSVWIHLLEWEDFARIELPSPRLFVLTGTSMKEGKSILWKQDAV